MLAKNEGFHLVEDGVITEVERAALVSLRDDLRNNKIVKHRGLWDQNESPGSERFCMDAWLVSTPHCGTVGCIGGLCFHRTNGAAFRDIITYHITHHLGIMDPQNRTYLTRRKKLDELFLPPHQAQRTPEEGAHAITTFLETGNAEWAEID